MGTALAWGGVIFGSFQYDDFANVLDDPATSDPDALAARLAGGIRPLTRLTHALCAWLFGEWAGGWLLVQWLVHLLVVLGVGRLASLRTGDARAGLLAAACFAVLPSHGAAVAYVSGRSIELATALLTGALLSHEQARRSHRSHWYSVLAVALFLLACGAKEIAVVFPGLVLLWESTRDRSAAWSRCWTATVPYLLAALAVLALMWGWSPRYRDLLEFSFDYRSPLQSLAHNLAALPATLSLGLRPWALSIEHAAPSGFLAVAAGTATICLAIVAAVRLRRHQPLATLALLWPIIALLPTHSVIAKLDSVTEGPLYLACVGPAICGGSWTANWLQESRRRLSICAAALLIAIGLCMWRTYVWSGPTRLWQEAVTRTPDSPRAWTNLGMAHLNADDVRQAQQAFRTALHLDPANARAMLNLEIIAAVYPDPMKPHATE